MSLITAIQPQKKDPTRVNIFLDGQFAFGVSRESQIVNKLKINENLSQDQIQKLIFQDQVERLYNKAIKFLSYRPRSEKEIRDNLLQKLYKTDKGDEEKKNFGTSIDDVIEKLKKVGQVNDQEFTTWWVEQRTGFKKLSPRVIKGELWKKGIAKEMIDETLAENSVDPYQLAFEAATKKVSSYKRLQSEEFKIKMGRFLGSRGFNWDVIKKVVDTLVQSR